MMKKKFYKAPQTSIEQSFTKGYVMDGVSGTEENAFGGDSDANQFQLEDEGDIFVSAQSNLWDE